MCGRCHFSAGLLDEIRDSTEQGDWRLELGVLDRDTHPSDTAPVIAAAGDQGGSLRARRQEWGYSGPDGKELVFNAESESVFEKWMFRDSVSRRRAAVPISWSYEWNKNKGKFTFTKEGSRILFPAGPHSRYEDGDRFAMLATQTNASMAPIRDRIPLVPEREQAREWILGNKKTRELLGQEPFRLTGGCGYEQQTLF